MTARKHYTLGPSGAPAWSLCAAKPTRELGLPDQTSEHAAWGTVAHDLSEQTLTTPGFVLADLRNVRARVTDHGDVVYEGPDCDPADYPIVVDDEMLACVQSYVEIVRSLPGDIYIESRVPIDHITGEPDGSGTADCLAIQWAERHMDVVDLKGGQGVRVDAFELIGEDIDVLTGEITPRIVPNFQLALYAAGALRKHDPDGRITDIRLMIVQPRLNHVSEYELTREQLAELMQYLAARAEATRDPLAVATPGAKQCRFCRAKAQCPELQTFVLNSAIDGFPNLDAPVEKWKTPAVNSLTASEALKLVPLIEDWCAAVRAQVYADLQAGVPNPHWKLVEGRRGDRAWKNLDEVQAYLVSALRHNEMYAYKLVSPAQAETLLKKRAPAVWEALQEHIAQTNGKPSVAPSSDRRPALVVGQSADDFQDLTTTDVAPEVADLF